MSKAKSLFKGIAGDLGFQNFILWLIVCNAVMLGLETSPSINEYYGEWFFIFDLAVQLIFTFEIAIRILAFTPKPLHFFKNGWNLFDFLIVILSFAPTYGSFATLARLFRLLRLTRIVSVHSELRVLVSTMLKTLPSLGYLGVLLGLVMYVYSIMGFHLYGEVDPTHWGSLGSCFLTLIQMLTLDNWNQIQATALNHYSYAWVFFCSYILIVAFLVVNLLVGVMVESLHQVREQKDSKEDSESLEALIRQLKAAVNSLEQKTQSTKNVGE